MSDARVIGERYRIDALLGEGGMGEVHRAWDERLQRAVALKLVKTGPTPTVDDARAYLARALREARSVAALSHPGIVAVHDVGEADGAPFVVMELVLGASLRDLLADRTKPIETRLRWLVDVARALHAAHAAGLVHRDVKPDNVMVRTDGIVKVLDFGIARRTAVADASLAATAAVATVEGAVAGTPAYMAPEQVRREELDGRADQFRVGVLAYELVTGILPWSTTNAGFGALLACVLAELVPGPFARLGTRSPEAMAIDAVVLPALSKAKSDRSPRWQMRRTLWSAPALAAKGDRDGARGAFQRVLDRWGGATSASAEHAQQRIDAPNAR